MAADDEKNEDVEPAAVEGEGLDPEKGPKEDPAAPEANAEGEEPAAEEKPKRKRAPRKKAEAKADDDAAEEKPKRRARKKAEPKAEDEAAAEEPSADEVAEQAKDDEVDKPRRRRRRGAAEVSAGSERKASKRTDADGKITVRAKARYVRTAPRKARLVVDHIRGKSVDEARAILIHTPRAASRDVLKLLDSAIANAENNHELVADELKIDRVFVDEGPTLKRYQPRALGRATQIRKRTSHMTILLTPKE
jgi:ribosomal protein L22